MSLTKIGNNTQYGNELNGFCWENIVNPLLTRLIGLVFWFCNPTAGGLGFWIYSPLYIMEQPEARAPRRTPIPPYPGPFVRMLSDTRFCSRLPHLSNQPKNEWGNGLGERYFLNIAVICWLIALSSWGFRSYEENIYLVPTSPRITQDHAGPLIPWIWAGSPLNLSSLSFL